VDASNFSFLGWTEGRYYEVCTSDSVYEYIESHLAHGAARVRQEAT
jgi:hypothetical protein